MPKFSIKCTQISTNLGRLYGGADHVDERHRHRYEVNPKLVHDLEKHGMRFTGQSEDGNRMEIMELQGHPYYVGVQYHPEYLSRPTRPSPPYVGFILAACGKLRAILADDRIQLNSKKYFYLNAHDGSSPQLINHASAASAAAAALFMNGQHNAADSVKNGTVID